MEPKITKLTLKHLSQSDDSTVSALLTAAGGRLCYIIEDGYRKVKVNHETRIPAGTYEIVPRTDKDSKFLQRYAFAYGHKFVPHIIGVPNFTWILLHIGNTISDTSGCLLPNGRYFKNGNDYEGRESKTAYLALYAHLDKLFAAGHRVYIEIARGEVEKEPDPLIEVDPPPIRDLSEPELTSTPRPPYIPANRGPSCLPLLGLALLLFCVFGFVVLHT